MAIIKYRESPTAEWKELPVANMVSMGYLPEGAITGNCTLRFADDYWDWFVNYFQDNITTKDITNMTEMFLRSNLQEIPFEINCKEGSNISVTRMFKYCRNLTKIPKINNCRLTGIKEMFSVCQKLREFPEDIADWFDWSYIDKSATAECGYLFQNCNSLRTAPMELVAHGANNSGYYYAIFTSLFNACSSLDEVIDLPNPHYNATWTSNALSGVVSSCYRLKNFTFKCPNGAPYVVKWKNQTIDLTYYVGYVESRFLTNITGMNSGITADKEVTDDATYQALKNDPDWFTQDVNYCRYNHDSAVATINSLPDASAYLATAGGTNTIKFKGASGSATDGGAINTLTDAEIAVAAAKGWTVTLS